jgi:hypothetical protein
VIGRRWRVSIGEWTVNGDEWPFARVARRRRELRDTRFSTYVLSADRVSDARQFLPVVKASFDDLIQPPAVILTRFRGRPKRQGGEIPRFEGVLS